MTGEDRTFQPSSPIPWPGAGTGEHLKGAWSGLAGYWKMDGDDA